MKYIIALFFLLSAHLAFAENPNVVIDTNKGKITLVLFPDEAPKTVANFLSYIEKDEFKETIFHRVINQFMIQGGEFSVSGTSLATVAPVENESKGGLSNLRGTIAMARTSDPHSAARQFYINEIDNEFLDAKEGYWGYTVFGQVVSGMDTVEKIAQVKTGAQDKPVKPIVIHSIKVLEK